MKASGITAIGLVAAAGLWIASGHLLPRDSAEGHAAVRAPEAVKKAFRVAVVEVRLVPHSRKLTISGRTEAERHGTITARTGGIVTELKIKRGTRVKEGEVLAVLSDDARAAQVAQGKSLVFQRRTELESKRKLIETGAHPAARARQHGSRAQDRGSRARGGRGRARPRRRRRAVERGDQRRHGRGRRCGVLVPGPRACEDRVARSDAGGGRGCRAQARRPQGRRAGAGAARHRRGRRRPHPPRRQDREPVDPDLPGRGRAAERRRRDPRRHYRGGVRAARQGRGGAGAALGAHHRLERRHRRAHRQRRSAGSASPPSTSSRTSSRRCGSRGSPTGPG